MSTLFITILIALLSTLPSDSKVEWKGEYVAPSVIIQELQSMEEQENNVAPAAETPAEEAAPEAEETTPAEEESAPSSENEGPVNEKQGVSAVSA